jgi:hypothetical protein
LFDFQGFISSLDALVKEAEAANIKVILRTTPPISTNLSGYTTQINSTIAGYGAAGLRIIFPSSTTRISCVVAPA